MLDLSLNQQHQKLEVYRFLKCQEEVMVSLGFPTQLAALQWGLTRKGWPSWLLTKLIYHKYFLIKCQILCASLRRMAVMAINEEDMEFRIQRRRQAKKRFHKVPEKSCMLPSSRTQKTKGWTEAWGCRQTPVSLGTKWARHVDVTLNTERDVLDYT